MQSAKANLSNKIAVPLSAPFRCTFTFADGRQCRTPRQSGHPHFCFSHARKEAQARAAIEAGCDISAFLSGSYLSACDLSSALARLFAAVAQGQIKPRTAATLAYLGQTLVQTIQLAQQEYINAFGTDAWREVVRSSFSTGPAEEGAQEFSRESTPPGALDSPRAFVEAVLAGANQARS